MQTIRCAVVMAAVMLAGGCAQILGIEELSQQPGDAGPSDFAVRGTATGVLGPVALELRLGDSNDLLTITQDGSFEFATRLGDGTSYTVELANPDLPCTLRNQTGVIAGAEPHIELTCTGASLASAVVNGVAPAFSLVSGTTLYEVELPLLQQSVTVTATVATAGDTLAIAGKPVASGAPSADISLSLGDNPVDIVVENNLGWRRTYRLTLRRALPSTVARSTCSAARARPGCRRPTSKRPTPAPTTSSATAWRCRATPSQLAPISRTARRKVWAATRTTTGP
jgi:hypothetical protein